MVSVLRSILLRRRDWGITNLQSVLTNDREDFKTEVIWKIKIRKLQ
jgi:hypothetical protein